MMCSSSAAHGPARDGHISTRVVPVIAGLNVRHHFSLNISQLNTVDMTEKNQEHQSSTSQHVESHDPEKNQPQVVIPEERQSVIRRKVHQSFNVIYLTYNLP